MTAVIIDTSVWVNFFRGNLSKKDLETISLLIESDQVVITDIIFHEVLVGARSDSDLKDLRQIVSAIKRLIISPEEIEELSSFGYRLKKQGLLGRYTDITIAFIAAREKIPIWSLDQYFKKLAAARIITILH